MNFDWTKYRIPLDKASYIQEMVQRTNVILTVTKLSVNPNLDIEMVQRTVGTKRIISQDLYAHFVLSLSTKHTFRKIYTSLQKKFCSNNGCFTVNPQIAEYASVPPDILPLYMLICEFASFRVEWQNLIENNIYLWAEMAGSVYVDYLNTSPDYIYDMFDRRRQALQSVIDIFGYNTIEQAVEDLLVCGDCGTRFTK